MDCPSQLALILLSTLSLISASSQNNITVIISQGSLEGLELIWARSILLSREYHMPSPRLVYGAFRKSARIAFYCDTKLYRAHEKSLRSLAITGIPQPVMVFIHGGGWLLGTGSVYAPDFIIEKNVVLVTFNYRLGVFGFMSTEDDILPGNLGMKDQVAALQWVQENIYAFGGDASKVTLFGHSAGAASVHYHMISPASQGLFHRAISQSGVALCSWCYIVPEAARMRAKKIATALDCSHEPTALKKCLMEKTAEDIVLSTLSFIDYDFFLPTPFGVVQERESKGAFLTTDPWTAPRRNISWMVRLNSGDGAYKVARLVEEDNINVQVYTDGGFLLGIEEAIERHIGLVFMYYFDHRGNHSSLDQSKLHVDLGVSHGDEMQYLFPSKSNADLKASEDKMVSRRMVNYWTNFAIHGNPSPHPDENTVPWTPRTASKEYLHITSHGNSMEKELRDNYVQFWKKLFPH